MLVNKYLVEHSCWVTQCLSYPGKVKGLLGGNKANCMGMGVPQKLKVSVTDRIFSELILSAQCSALLGSCVPSRPLALNWHVLNSCLRLVSTAHTRKWVSKCSNKPWMAHVGLRDISRSKMLVKWDTFVGELVQVLAYDSSCILSIVESLPICSLLGQICFV